MDEKIRARLSAMAEEYQQHAGPCHRADHTRRVVRTAGELAAHYAQVDRDVLEAAAWLHDIGHGRQKHGVSHADISAVLAAELLPGLGFPPAQVEVICRMIADHRFSGGRTPHRLEGRLLQDADRLDALGAIGIARTFSEGNHRDLYHAADPFAAQRAPDDDRYTLDHFFTKLLALAETMHTPEARALARHRIAVMQAFLRELADEIVMPCA